MTTFETPKTPQQFVETMLRSCIDADQLTSENINDRLLREAHTHAAVNGLIAALALEHLHRIAPDNASDLAEHLDQLLTAGDIEGPAFRTAKALGHDPDQWIADFKERATSRRDKRATEAAGIDRDGS